MSILCISSFSFIIIDCRLVIIILIIHVVFVFLGDGESMGRPGGSPSQCHKRCRHTPEGGGHIRHPPLRGSPPGGERTRERRGGGGTNPTLPAASHKPRNTCDGGCETGAGVGGKREEGEGGKGGRRLHQVIA